MGSKKLPMDLQTTYRKDFIPFPVGRPPPHKEDRDYEDPLSGPFTEYILPEYKWDKRDPKLEKEEHPRKFFKRMWDDKKLMPTYTEDVPQCYCIKMLNKIPQMEPPDKEIIAQHYRNKNKTLYHMDYSGPDSNYKPLKKSLRKLSLVLPDDHEVPLTTYTTSYRPREITKKYMDFEPSPPIPRPLDNTRPNEKIREIMKVRTGDSEYEGVIGELGAMVLREQMHGDVKRRAVANEFELMRQQKKLKGPAHATLQGPQQAGFSTHPIAGAQYLTELPNQPPGPLGCGCCGCRFSQQQGRSSPLLDVVLFPASVGSAPQTETSQFDQPNTYLRKLAEKYPYMFNILKSAPPDELIAKVYRDRMITTYQADYCKMGEYETEPFNNLIRAGGMQGSFMLDIPILLPDCSYRPQQRRIFRPNVMSKMGCLPKEKEVAAPTSTKHEFVPTGRWKSEYMDTISRLGDSIIRDKLHQHRGPGPGRK